MSLGTATEKVNLSVHRLVALAYIPNPNDLPQVNHIDGNKNNNSVNNLEWCTNQYNCDHAYTTNLKKPVDYLLVTILYCQTNLTLDQIAKQADCSRAKVIAIGKGLKRLATAKTQNYPCYLAITILLNQTSWSYRKIGRALGCSHNIVSKLAHLSN